MSASDASFNFADDSPDLIRKLGKSVGRWPSSERPGLVQGYIEGHIHSEVDVTVGSSCSEYQLVIHHVPFGKERHAESIGVNINAASILGPPHLDHLPSQLTTDTVFATGRFGQIANNVVTANVFIPSWVRLQSPKYRPNLLGKLRDPTFEVSWAVSDRKIDTLDSIDVLAGDGSNGGTSRLVQGVSEFIDSGNCDGSQSVWDNGVELEFERLVACSWVGINDTAAIAIPKDGFADILKFRKVFPYSVD